MGTHGPPEFQGKCQDEAKSLRDKLEGLAPGLREKIHEKRLASLTPEELAAYESEKPPYEMNHDEMMAQSSALEKLRITDVDVVKAVPEDVRSKASYYAKRAIETDLYVSRISSYAIQVNYEYWKTRCDVEQSKVTADARRLMWLAEEEAENADPEGARDQYEQAWDEWVKIFDEHPELVHDVMAEDLNVVILRYRQVLDQLDEDFPGDFKLQMLIDAIAERPPTTPPSGS